MRFLLVLIGGAAGSGARYLLGVWMVERFGVAFPWSTITVNVLGSFLIGIVATIADEQRTISPDTRALLVAGVLGGFTTFSSFSLETLRLWETHGIERAVLNVAASVVLSLGAAVLGAVVVRGLA